MRLLRKKSKSKPQIGATEISELAVQERTIEEEISKLEEMLTEAPERIRRQYEENRSLMPPPDDWEERQRVRKFHAKLSKGELRNAHRYQTRSTFLFILLSFAILSILAWIYNYLNATS